MNIFDLAKEGKTAELLAFIEKGANIETNDEWGKTPLHWACRRGHTNTVIALLDKGANIEAVSGVGLTPLHYACWYGRTEMAIALLGKGANIEAVSGVGQTPLHFTCWYGRTDTAIALLEKGANIEKRDKRNNLSLDYANKEVLIAIYLYYCNKNENDKADWLQEKYGLQIKDLL